MDLEACIPSVTKPRADGYALRAIGGRRKQYEHVLAWEGVHGPVPEGKVLDHICHDPETCPGGPCSHRSCRNVAHLTPVTRGANVSRDRSKSRRKARCPSGHEYTPDNTRVRVDPVTGYEHWHCRACTRRHIAEHKSRKRAIA